jgi:hypothetical protein
MFSTLDLMLASIVLVVCLGLFLDYGKRKHWDKSSDGEK